MPTNVGAEYLAAEEKYLKAKDKKEKIKWLKEMLRLVPKHKGTEKLVAQLRKKLNKLEKELEKERIKRVSKKSEFSIEKEGDVIVSIIGCPNVGKSTLLSKLTNSKPLIADYPFTTTKPEIGILNYGGTLIQLIDLPPLIENTYEERREIFSVINNSDLVIIMFDLSQDIEEQLKIIFGEIKKAKIVIGKEKPHIKIKKVEKGGLEVVGLKKEEIEKAKEILRKHKINNALVEIKGSLRDLEFVLNNFKFIKGIVVANKGDLPNTLDNYKKLEEKIKEFNLKIVPISALKEKNLDLLKKTIWEELDLIRVFTKDPRKKEVEEEPITLKKGSTVEDLVEKIHQDFLKKFKYAKVYGKSVKFNGQTVGLKHVLEDKDIVEIYLNK